MSQVIIVPPEIDVKGTVTDFLTLASKRNLRPEAVLLALADVMASTALALDAERPMRIDDRLDSFTRRVIRRYGEMLTAGSQERRA